jgi:hypothetical protein
MVEVLGDKIRNILGQPDVRRYLKSMREKLRLLALV